MVSGILAMYFIWMSLWVHRRFSTILHKATGSMFLLSAWPLKPKDHHIDNLLVTGCTGGCQNDNLGCSQWREGCRYDNLLVSVPVGLFIRPSCPNRFEILLRAWQYHCRAVYISTQFDKWTVDPWRMRLSDICEYWDRLISIIIFPILYEHLKSWRQSDAYMRQLTNHHWFR